VMGHAQLSKPSGHISMGDGLDNWRAREGDFITGDALTRELSKGRTDSDTEKAVRSARCMWARRSESDPLPARQVEHLRVQ
jgi:hypothetical protein